MKKDEGSSSGSSQSQNKSANNESVKLSKQERAELNDILANEEVKELIFAAEVCLLAKNIDTDFINKKLVPKIKKLKLPRVSSNVWKNLEIIFNNILISLKQQQTFFINQLVDKFLSSYEVFSSEDPFDKLQKLFEESCENLELSKNRYTIALSPQERKKISSLKASASWLYLYNIFCIVFGVSGTAFFSAYGIYLALDEDGFNLSNREELSTLASLIVCLLTLTIYRNKTSNHLLSYGKESAAQSQFPKFTLKNIRVVNSDGVTEEIIYKPAFKINTTERSQVPTSSQDEQPSAPPKPKRRHRSEETPPLESKKPKKISVAWSEDKILCGRANRTIPAEKLFEMRGRGGNKPGVHYVGIFNERAVRKQGITTNDPEWKGYKGVIEKGLITTERGGLKPLDPAVLMHVKFKEEDYGMHIYKYEDRIIGQKYRLLGEVCAEQKDENGETWKLVDFNLHLPNGLH